MLPSHHAASAVTAGVVLRRLGWSWGAVGLFAAGAVLLDVDHYLAAVWRTGDLSLARAYREHPRGARRVEGARRRADSGFRFRLRFWGGYNRPLHSVPALATLGVVAWAVAGLRPLALGVALHRALDYVWEGRPRR